MAVHSLDPLTDPRWTAYLQQNALASVYHTPGWLEALRRTYGHLPVVYSTSPPGRELRNGLLFCDVRSWLTGHRLVSLPFSDHCRPLYEDANDLVLILEALERERNRHGWRYVECRLPDATPLPQLQARRFGISTQYYTHTLDLRPGCDQIYSRFHPSCIQRKIRRAEREALRYEDGTSERYLRAFYRLMVITRRRHGLPPQPYSWFRNLVDCLGDRISIGTASKEERPIAAIITLCHGGTVVYKYGCSDPQFNCLGGMPALFWKTIQDATAAGAERLDLGRSDTDQPGLVAFKEHLGATRAELSYLRSPMTAHKCPDARMGALKKKLAERVVRRLPERMLTLAGALLYRHMA